MATCCLSEAAGYCGGCFLISRLVYALDLGVIYAAAFSGGELKSMLSSVAYLWLQQSLIM